VIIWTYRLISGEEVCVKGSGAAEGHNNAIGEQPLALLNNIAVPLYIQHSMYPSAGPKQLQHNLR
jgi:hypothetical protein